MNIVRRKFLLISIGTWRVKIVLLLQKYKRYIIVFSLLCSSIYFDSICSMWYLVLREVETRNKSNSSMNQTPNNKLFNYFLTSLRHVTLFFPPLFWSALSPSNSLLTTVEEIEKAVYEGQAHRSLYLQATTRVKKIEGIIKLAAQHGNRQFLRQACVVHYHQHRERQALFPDFAS